MLWAIFLHSTILFGFQLTSLVLPKTFDTLDQLGIGIPLGITLVSWIFYGIRCFMKLNEYVIIIGSMALYCISIVLFIIKPKKMIFRKITVESIVVFILMEVLVSYMLYNSILKKTIYSAGTVYSDIPVHLGLITSFAYGVNSGPKQKQTPFYSGVKLCYPIIPDYFSSLMVIAGSSLRTSIALPSLVVYTALLIALHRVGSSFSKRKFVPELTIIFFTFCGGIGWKWQFIPDCFKDPNANATHAFCKDRYTFWINTLVHFLLPQRSGLFSMPLDIYAVELIILFVESRFKDLISIGFAGFIMGCLPMISAHSYIAVGEYAIFICINTFPWMDTKKWLDMIMKWGFFASVSLIVAIPQIIDLIGHGHRQMFSIEPIWNETEVHPRFLFIRIWWDSLSTFVVLALFLVWFSLNSTQVRRYLPTIGLFIVSNFVRYQPGAMDNTKVFIAAWLPLASAAVAHLVTSVASRSFKRRDYGILMALIVTVACFLAGSVFSVYKFNRYEYTLFSEVERDFGLWAMESTHPDSVFMGSWWHAHPAMVLGGRAVTNGYPGWVWTHGLSIDDRQKMVDGLLSQLDNQTAFLEHNIKYIVTREADRERNFAFPGVEGHPGWMTILETGVFSVHRLLE